MSHHIVEARDLCHIFPDGTTALDGVSFRITHGESVAVIGANGAGKSTLLLHLNGCLSATSGEIRIGDTPLTAGTLPDIRRTVGMIFQDPDDQLFMPTVFDDVAFGPCNLGLSGSDVDQRVTQTLELVGAGHLRDKPPYNLSGGEKKRNEIFQMAMLEPKLAILDETDSGLDIDALKIVSHGVNKLRTKTNAVIVVTHYQRLLDYIVPDFVHVLYKGKIVKSGNKDLALELEAKGYDWIKDEVAVA